MMSCSTYLLLLTVGCVQESDAPPDSGVADFVPDEGSYTFDREALVGNCAFVGDVFVMEGRPGSWTGDLSEASGSGFTLSIESTDYACSLDGQSSRCEFMDELEPFGDYVDFQTTSYADLVWSDASAASGPYVYEVACVGDLCDDVAAELAYIGWTIPCRSEGQLSLSQE